MYLLSRILLTCLTTCCLLAAYSQKHRENYTISLPEQKASDSRYNRLVFIDGRADTSNMGIVQVGAFNKKALVIAETPLEQQFQAVFNQLVDSSAKQGQCVFLLRQLSFAEVTKAMSERGYCYLRAALFATAGEGYQMINTIDTVILVKAFDVTRAMFRRGSSTIQEFIGQNLQRTAREEHLYSLTDIRALDSVEKRGIPVYNTTTYANGVYATYEAFKEQKPDLPAAVIETDREGMFVVKVTNEKGKLQKVKSENLYALVKEGTPYIATAFGYYQLDKRDDNFYFTGKTKVAASQGDIMAASMFFGIIGGLLASQADVAVFEMKIDHVGGGFIRLKEVQ